MFCTTDKVDVDIFDIFDQKAKEMDKEKKEKLGVKMENRYFEEDYNKEYEINDLNRVVKGTFDAYKYFGGQIFSAGPWRVLALEKFKEDSNFKDFFKTIPEYKRNLGYLCSHKIQNEEFEKLAGKCRLEWNEKFNYKLEIKSCEDAFKKALFVLKKMYPNEKDPFNKRRVEVLYDAKNKLYLVNETDDFRIFMRKVGKHNSVLFDEKGSVVSVFGCFMQ